MLIISIGIFEPEGNQILIPSSTSFDIKLTLKSYRDLDAVRLGCFVANKNGKRVTGQSFPKRIGQGFSMRAGESKIISLGFLGGLWPGLYFVGAGLSETKSTGIFLHRLIDEAVMRVVDTHYSQPIGDTDLSRS